jgi:hypothetical protein
MEFLVVAGVDTSNKLMMEITTNQDYKVTLSTWLAYVSSQGSDIARHLLDNLQDGINKASHTPNPLW